MKVVVDTDQARVPHLFRPAPASLCPISPHPGSGACSEWPMRPSDWLIKGK